MNNLNDEKRFEEIIDKLKSLNKISAPDYFESNLMRRINQEDFSKEKPEIKSKFSLSRLVPSSALVLTTIIIVLILQSSDKKILDPLQIEPKPKEEIIHREKLGAIPDESNSPIGSVDNKSTGEMIFESGEPSLLSAPVLKDESKKTEDFMPNSEIMNELNVTTEGVTAPGQFEKSLDKSNLNFKQILLSDSQKQKIEMLKEKMDSLQLKKDSTKTRLK
jgi:hypothetical protein